MASLLNAELPINKYNSKIRKCLQRFLDPNFKVRNDVYLNSLYLNITKLELSEEYPLDTDPYIIWLKKALNAWSSGSHPSPCVITFSLNLTSYLCKRELTFVKLQTFQCLDKLVLMFSLDDISISQNLKHAFIKILNACLEHEGGVRWIMTTNFCCNVLAFILTNQTIYITREGYKFVAGLLEKASKIDLEYCVNFIEIILSPLKEQYQFNRENDEQVAIIDNDALFRNLEPTLLLLSGIFEIFLENITPASDFVIIKMFMQRYEIEDVIYKYFVISQCKEFALCLSKVLLPIPFFVLSEEVLRAREMNSYIGTKFLKKLYKVFTESINKNYTDNILQLCYWSSKYEKIAFKDLVKQVLVKQDKPEDIFEHQMLLLQSIPIIGIGYKLRDEQKELLEQDEIRGLFMDKVFKRTTQSTMRTIYNWRKYKLTAPISFDDATLSLNYLLKSRVFYSRTPAIMAFQSMIYCLNDLIHTLKEKPEFVMTLSEEQTFLATLLEAIAIYVAEYEITWRDSVETICVMDLVFELLKFPHWSTTVVVKALKLIEIAVSKYMTPNMVLLVDINKDSAIGMIGTLLYGKLHDPTWEVRDSALEVLRTISENAVSKFPSFQKVILESDLTSLVIKMALNDRESFVRMTAVKCLQCMIVINDLWIDIKEVQNLHNCMLNSIIYETEAIVRKEVVCLVTKSYENQLFPDKVIDRVYDTMCHASLSDLHWEVKVNALSFWEQVIKLHLQNQGMIDGIFPKMTFSKETKKIVTLTNAEIQKRLNKVLNQLNWTGCLSVLISGIKDDCDLEVSKKALAITQPFLNLLKQYEVDSCNIENNTPPSPLHMNFNNSPAPSSSYSDHGSRTDESIASPFSVNSPYLSSVDSGINTNSPVYAPVPDYSEDIVEDILNNRDLNLLQGMLNPDDRPPNGVLPLKKRRTTTPKEFLEFTSQDLERLIGEKQNWIKSIDDFDSLLNDILREYHEDNINNMDCY